MKSKLSLLNTVNISLTLSQRLKYLESVSVLTSKERLIVYAMISLLEPEDQEFQEFRCNITQFCKLLNIDIKGGLQRKHFLSSLEKLGNKGFVIETADGSKTVISKWMSKSYYDADTKEVVLQLNHQLKPYLLNLTGRARTIFQLGYSIKFKLKHTAMLYLLLHSAAGRKDYRIPIDRLRFMLGSLHSKYKYFDIKHFVLEPSLAEINLYSDLLVAEKPVRKGKCIVGVSFFVRLKTKSERKEIERFKFPDNKKQITEEELMRLPSGNWYQNMIIDEDDNRRFAAIERKSSFRRLICIELARLRHEIEPPFLKIAMWKAMWNYKRRKRRQQRLEQEKNPVPVLCPT